MARLGLTAALLSLGAAAAAAALLISGVGGALGPGGVFGLRLAPHQLAPGLQIAGTPLEPGADLAAQVEALSARLEAEPVELVAPPARDGTDGVLIPATIGELGFHVDRAAVIERARSFGRRATWLGRAFEIGRLQRAAPDLPLAPNLDSGVLFARLAAVKADHERAAQPARHDAERRSITAHVTGRHLDLDRLGDALWLVVKARAEQLQPSPLSPTARIPMPFVEIVPRVSSLAATELSGELQLVSEFSTRFRTRGDQATRAQNIAIAAQRLDGWILLPGDRMSFNAVVGERSEANGFEESWQILEGEMVRGMGGGTCQVSSTLHAAALHAGLHVIESYPHSRPLAYIEKGLDATVAWPFVDLKLQNPWPVALAIQAVVDAGKLTLRFWATTKPASVRIVRDTKEVVPFPRVVEVSSRMVGFKRKQEGIPGYEIERVRYILPAGGEAKREVHTNRYRPTPELYLIGPDLDLEELPPLPEGAEGAPSIN